MRKKLTSWKKAYKIAYLVLMTLLNLRNAEAEHIIERKIRAILEILGE
jgi:hypothetical protein